ncbi:hypothetical protein HHK36_011108 [Tetracentron sinense]|uniref:Uncharacterized protein n=1 Tax=Tetracentron sinense TaxID=13715 RepID=A0A834ZCW0_TETSI|nr:hypothetical protein HHK36_011108 [Tetracentron sinense]
MTFDIMTSAMQSNNGGYSEPIGDMEYNVELIKNSRHHQTSRIVKELDQEESNSSGDHQKQWAERKATEDDKLVKYMSNLPGYTQRVERGEKLQEKALKFGAQNWGRLEKLKRDQKLIPGRSSRNTVSTNSNFPFSIAGSSTPPSRGHSGSPTHQRKQWPSLHSHLNTSPKESCSQGNVIDIQDFKTTPNDTMAGQQKLPRTDQSFGKYHSETKLENGKRKDSSPKTIPEVGNSSSKLKEYEVSSSSKGKMKARDGESEKRAEQLQELESNHADQRCPGRHKKIVLVLPKGYSENSCSAKAQLSASRTLDDRRSTIENRKSFSDSFYLEEEVHSPELYSGIPYTCPPHCRVECSKQTDMKLPSSVGDQGINTPAAESHLLPYSDEITSGSKGKNAEEKKSIIKPSNPNVIKPSARSNSKTAEAATAKGRNPSPNHRFSIGMGGMSRSFSFKEGSAVPQLSSAYVTAKSGPVRSEASACLDNPNRDKANINSRTRSSSPLRRLLDPLLKSKAANRLHSPEPLPKESTSTHAACKSSDGQIDSSIVQPVKRHINFLSFRPTKTNDLHQDEKLESSTVQALLQVTVKNGLPLFTFAVDNNSDILAATMRKISTSGKDDYTSIYTFHSVCEIKKSRGWTNQGMKGKNCDYVSSIVGQMKVFSSQCPKLTSHNPTDQIMVREFVLFGGESRQADQETPDYQPNSELAAIVVKFPEETMGNISNDGRHSYKYENLSEKSLTECFREERWSCSSGENLQNETAVGSQNLFRAVVILPSGVHGLPSTGEPSPLIARWKSGGSCDCGGWDVGCKLRIFANQDIQSKNLSSSEACPTLDQFDLYIQGGAQENRLFFRLAPFKNGVYSVNFNASISLLQAFSISMAVLNSRKPSDFAEVNTLLESKTSQEPI